MNGQRCLVLVLVFGAGLAGCTSSDNPPKCSFDQPAQLARSTWPKFRANVQNTGAVTVAVAASRQIAWRFPPPGEGPTLPFTASPVINDDGSLIYIGSADHTLYALRTDSGRRADFNVILSEPITSTAVAAVREGEDAVFVGGGDARLYAVVDAGAAQASYWPYLFGAFISASPTLYTDGTVYVGGQDGLFLGVCPNGIARFAVSASSIKSSAALGTDGTLYFGADDRQLRALRVDGSPLWTFSASAPIVAAPVFEVQGTAAVVYVADRGGRVFKVDTTSGRPVPGFNAVPVMPIASSPALANGRLYYGSDDGNLYAINTSDGTAAWTTPVQTGGAIVSSPAVAVNGTSVVVIVGSNDGNLYYVTDDGGSTPTSTALTLCPEPPCSSFCGQPPCRPDQPQAIESSPAIGADGTVYVGTDGGYVYAID